VRNFILVQWIFTYSILRGTTVVYFTMQGVKQSQFPKDFLQFDIFVRYSVGGEGKTGCGQNWVPSLVLLSNSVTTGLCLK
jgi:hypothetical protein